MLQSVQHLFMFEFEVTMQLLERIAQYMMWANDTIWKLVESLSDEEFIRALDQHGTSIRRKYTHLALDTWEWYYDWTGEECGEEPDFTTMSRAELFSFISDHSQKWLGLVDNRSVESLKMKRGGRTFILLFEEILFHMTNHMTYHRGQIVMGLRMLGKDVPITDYVPYRANVP